MEDRANSRSLGTMLVDRGIIPPAALDDPEGYDHGYTVEAIADLELEIALRATPTCGTCGRQCLPDGSCYECVADRLRKENDHLRTSLANGPGACPYCKLPREEWSKCASGFPGCGRADDAMMCPHVGAGMKEDALRAALLGLAWKHPRLTSPCWCEMAADTHSATCLAAREAMGEEKER